MCICHVDGLIFLTPDADINELADKLISDVVTPEQDSDVAGFLGVKMETYPTTGFMDSV